MCRLLLGMRSKLAILTQPPKISRCSTESSELRSHADDIATRYDGSAAVAVVNALVPSVTANEEKVLSIRAVPKNIRQVSGFPDKAKCSLKVKVLLHHPQITHIALTDRINGGYVLGEKLGITLSGIGEPERYEVTIDNTMVGVTFHTAMSIVNKIVLLGKDSPNYEIAPSYYETFQVRPRDRTAGAFTVTVDYAGTSRIRIKNESDYVGPPDPVEPPVVTPQDDATLLRLSFLFKRLIEAMSQEDISVTQAVLNFKVQLKSGVEKGVELKVLVS